MSDTRERAIGFLREHGADVSAVDTRAVLADFQAQMDAGLAGIDSSLAMIPTFIDPHRPIPAMKPVVVMDAGGTNLRICTVAFADDGTPNIDDFTRHRMPGIDG